MTAIPEIDLKAVRAKFKLIRDRLDSCLIERTEEIDALTHAVLCKQHILLVGPPGTAKNMLLEGLLEAFDHSCQKFTLQLNGFTEPAEVFGPQDLVRLGGGKNRDLPSEYVRLTTRRLPEAHFSFLDEIFRGNRAILNTLLNILNERTFDRGDAKVKCPLQTAVCGANSFPGDGDGGDEEMINLAAMYDRLLFRRLVKPIETYEGKLRLIMADNQDLMPHFSDPEKLSLGELAAAQKAVSQVRISEGWSRAYIDLQHQLFAVTQQQISDRRVRAGRSVCQASAWLDGADEVGRNHMEQLKNVLWVVHTDGVPEQTARVVCDFSVPVKSAITKIGQDAETCYTEAMIPLVSASKVNECFSRILGMAEEMKKLREPASQLKGTTARRWTSVKARVDKIHKELGILNVRKAEGMR